MKSLTPFIIILSLMFLACSGEGEKEQEIPYSIVQDSSSVLDDYEMVTSPQVQEQYEKTTYKKLPFPVESYDVPDTTEKKIDSIFAAFSILEQSCFNPPVMEVFEHVQCVPTSSENSLLLKSKGNGSPVSIPVGTGSGLGEVPHTRVFSYCPSGGSDKDSIEIAIVGPSIFPKLTGNGGMHGKRIGLCAPKENRKSDNFPCHCMAKITFRFKKDGELIQILFASEKYTQNGYRNLNVDYDGGHPTRVFYSRRINDKNIIVWYNLVDSGDVKYKYSYYREKGGKPEGEGIIKQ